MGRTHTIKTHPQRKRIESMLADGIPQATVAREFSLAPATLSRFINSIKSDAAKIVEDQPGVTDVLARLVETAEHARLLRLQSKLTGSPVAQSRAIKGEQEILSKLLTELGIEDVTVGHVLEETHSLVVGIRTFVRTYPDSAADLVQVLAENPETTQLADALRSQMRK